MTGFFDRLPIKYKLIMIIMLISSVSLLLISGVLIIYDRYQTRELWTQKIVVVGEVIASRSTAAITFDDKELAEENLAALAALSAIRIACLYDSAYRLFATYKHGDSVMNGCPAYSMGNTEISNMPYEYEQVPIVLNGARIGTVVIGYSLEELDSRLYDYLLVVFAVLLGVLAIAYFMSIILQRVISKPVTQLTELANQVAREGEYNVKLIPRRQDEIGVLIDAFMEMLQKIDLRKTERDKAEAKLRKHQQNLEKVIAKRTRKLELAIKEIESFSYSVSHDLRAPLRSINGFSQILLEDYAHNFDEAGADALGRIRASSKRMGNLIDALLNLSRVSRNELTVTTVNLSNMVHELAEQYQAREPARRVSVAIEDNIVVIGDRYLLSIALENLFSNAWKYTAHRDDARIEFGQIRDGEKKIYFIRDNGAGFNMNYANKLFQPFQRLHDPLDFEGTGIGLATVARIIHRHDGDIWAEGETDKGATFYFSLHSH